MSITISADDPRTIRAIEIAADAGRWRVTRDSDGRELFRVPSQSDPRRLYLVTQSSCTCADFLHGEEEDQVCKHILAVRLYCELVRAQRPQAQRRSHLRLIR